MSRRTIYIILVGLFVALLVLCGVAVSRDARPKNQPIFIVPSPGSPVVTPRPSAGPWTGEGAFLVGKDMRAGTYRSAGATEGFCAWVVNKDQNQDAEVVAVGSASKASQPQRVTVKNGQVFESSGCLPWIKQ